MSVLRDGYVGSAPELVEEFLAELRAALAAYPDTEAEPGESVF